MLRGNALALVTIVALSSQGQTWCPPGAKWTFEYADVLGGQFGVQRVEYVGDTLLGGQLAQKLRETAVTAPWGTTDYTSIAYTSLFTYLDGSVVYEWNGVYYDTLMWFNALPGERWNAPGGGPDMGLMVLDTATVIIDGVPLKRLAVQSDLGWPDTLYERIGFQFLYLSGWSWFLTDMPWNGLMCYQDDNLSYTMADVSDCDFTLSATDAMDIQRSLPLPNPGTDGFTLTLPPGLHTVTLFDATGRAVLHKHTSYERTTIDASKLPSGVYLVRVDEGSVPLRWAKE